MSVALGGSGICSDSHPALIVMYQAVADGWDPPRTLTRDEWYSAKMLHDTDPLKAFAGFGCSYRGLYFSGYAGGYVSPTSRYGAIAARQTIRRDVLTLKRRGCVFESRDFFSIEPKPGVFLYLDPPYKGTAEYDGTSRFDYERFYRRVIEWAAFGPVCVSEYDFPLGECVWGMLKRKKLVDRNQYSAYEKLYVVGEIE